MLMFSNEKQSSISTRSSWFSTWPKWAGYAAAGWSLIYAVFGIYWGLGGSHFPFGENDPRAMMMGSFLTSLRADTGGLTIAATNLIGFAVALAMVKTSGRLILGWVLLFFSWLMCVTLLLVIPDVRIVQNFAYLFVLHVELVDWLVLNQVFCIAGGFLWGAAALSYHRKLNEACGCCGRKDDSHGASVKSAARWGKRFTYIAVVMALPYAIVRWAWAFGIPFGTTLDTNSSPPLIMMELFLGAMCIGGGILTLGLTQRWGEVFPRWFLFMAGKPVPVWLAVVPSTLMAAIITLAGVKMAPLIILMMLNGSITMENWGEAGPFLSWLPWGVSLGAATISYYIRRRGRCRHCGRL
ncbi:hypothetical protein ABES25_00955 [Bacillus gobiensis]|uniref:hypothetical protein n=1 Tax=Bacillus gobiensis TaxID=1441095 RepID=UPI003D2591E7